MSRIYTCPIVGDGSDRSPYRPLLADLTGGKPGRWEGTCASHLSGPRRGQPRLGWSVVSADYADWALVEADSRCVRVDKGLFRPSDAEQPPESAVTASLRASGALRGEPDTVLGMVDELVREHYPEASGAGFVLRAMGLPTPRGGVTFLKTFAQDDFTDSDGTLLENHSAIWERTSATGFGAGANSADIEIISNRISAQSLTVNSRVYRNATVPPGAAYTVRAQFNFGTVNAQGALLARVTETVSTPTAYYAAVVARSGSFSLLTLYKRNVSLTSLASSNIGVNVFPAEVSLDVSDSLKEASLFGLGSISSADNEVTQVGRPAVSAPKDALNGNWIDDFVAEAEVELIPDHIIPIDAPANIVVPVDAPSTIVVPVDAPETIVVEVT